MCRASFVKEREKNVKQLTMKIILNDQKYHELLQNSKILHTQSKPQGKIFDDFFYPNWQGTKLIINYSQLLT